MEQSSGQFLGSSFMRPKFWPQTGSLKKCPFDEEGKYTVAHSTADKLRGSGFSNVNLPDADSLAEMQPNSAPPHLCDPHPPPHDVGTTMKPNLGSNTPFKREKYGAEGRHSRLTAALCARKQMTPPTQNLQKNTRGGAELFAIQSNMPSSSAQQPGPARSSLQRGKTHCT